MPMTGQARGLFGAPMGGDLRAFDTPQVYSGINAPAVETLAPSAAPAKPSFFGQGGAGRAIAGNIGDALLALGGRQPLYAPAMQHRQDLADYDMKQQDELKRAIALKQWERDNPAPVNNDTVNDFKFISDQLGPEAAKQYLRNIGDPTVTVTLPGNRVYNGPRSGLAAAMGGMAQPAAAAPPAGVTFTPLPGGASPTGSRTFR